MITDWAELFTYNEETGLLIWKTRPSPRVKIGDVVGSIHHTGYRNVRVNKKNYLAHRIIWDMNNPGANCRNKSKHNTNTSGQMGVYYFKDYGKWRAQIVVSGILIFLGYFERKQDAITARKEAEVKYNFHENHGK
ncbi:hypothetical protein ACFL9L_004368 [Salmonella enterica]